MAGFRKRRPERATEPVGSTGAPNRAFVVAYQFTMTVRCFPPVCRCARFAGLCALALGAAGCSDPCSLPEAPPDPAALHSPYAGYFSPRYADNDNWLCRPGMDHDRCNADLDATELRADGTTQVAPHVRAQQSQADCFYVYPTMDLLGPPGLHKNTTNTAAEELALLSQGARFNAVCRVFAPVYRQMRMSTYLVDPGTRDRCLESAYGDVLDAFLHYMGQFNEGRPVVLIGHSQGAQHVTHLLQQLFDRDPRMMAQLVVALAIGGGVGTAPGSNVGGSFSQIPLCTRRSQRGCVVAYRSYAKGQAPLRGSVLLADEDQDLACVNPANGEGSGTTILSRAFFHANQVNGSRQRSTVRTPFVLLRDFYSATCVSGTAGHHLEIEERRVTGDQRPSPVRLNAPANRGRAGLHVHDFAFPLGDLLALVADKLAAP